MKRIHLYVYVGIITCLGLVHCTIPTMHRQTFCFDDYNMDEPEDIHGHLRCGEEDAVTQSDSFHIKIIDMEYWRPNEKGDRSCQRSQDAKCCEDWLNETIKCVVPVKPSMIQEVKDNCQGQSECAVSLKAKQLGNMCKEQCNDTSYSAGDWCWSRIVLVNFFCYQEFSNTTYIILLCVLIPVALLLGVFMTILIIKLKSKGYLHCNCLTKRVSRSTSYNVNLPRLASQPNNYQMEINASAAASSMSHSSTRRTGGRNSFAVEPMYYDTEDMLSIRESLGIEDLTNDAGVKASGNMAVSGGKNQRRCSSESGIVFDVSPPPPALRKVSIVKEMVSNPFYKTLGELSDLTEEQGSYQSRKSSDTFDMDNDVPAEALAGPVNNASRTIEGTTGDNEGEKVIRKENDVRPKSYANGDNGYYFAKQASQFDNGSRSNLNPKNSEFSLDVPTGEKYMKASVSPGMYVKFPEGKNLDDLQQFHSGVDTDNDMCKMSIEKQCILPVRKRHSEDTNVTSESTTSRHSSDIDSSEADTEDIQSTIKKSVHGSASKLDDNTGDINHSEKVIGRRASMSDKESSTPLDITMHNSTEVQLPRMSTRKSSSSSESSGCDSSSNGGHSDSEDNYYTPTFNGKYSNMENSVIGTKSELQDVTSGNGEEELTKISGNRVVDLEFKKLMRSGYEESSYCKRNSFSLSSGDNASQNGDAQTLRYDESGAISSSDKTKDGETSTSASDDLNIDTLGDSSFEAETNEKVAVESLIPFDSASHLNDNEVDLNVRSNKSVKMVSTSDKESWASGDVPVHYSTEVKLPKLSTRKTSSSSESSCDGFSGNVSHCDTEVDCFMPTGRRKFIDEEISIGKTIVETNEFAKDSCEQELMEASDNDLPNLKLNKIRHDGYEEANYGKANAFSLLNSDHDSHNGIKKTFGHDESGSPNAIMQIINGQSEPDNMNENRVEDSKLDIKLPTRRSSISSSSSSDDSDIVDETNSVEDGYMSFSSF